MPKKSLSRANLNHAVELQKCITYNSAIQIHYKYSFPFTVLPQDILTLWIKNTITMKYYPIKRWSLPKVDPLCIRSGLMETQSVTPNSGINITYSCFWIFILKNLRCIPVQIISGALLEKAAVNPGHWNINRPWPLTSFALHSISSDAIGPCLVIGYSIFHVNDA